MVKTATVECLNHVTASSRQRKVQFVDSLKLVAEHSLQNANPQFYKETCELMLELQDLLGLEEMSETFFHSGMFFAEQGNYSEARDALKNALKNNSSKPHFVDRCHFQMRVISCHMKNFQAARHRFKKL